jgi:hypothetical protein
VHITPTPSVRFEVHGTTEKGMEQLDYALQRAEESYGHEDEIEVIARVLRLSQEDD